MADANNSRLRLPGEFAIRRLPMKTREPAAVPPPARGHTATWLATDTDRVRGLKLSTPAGSHRGGQGSLDLLHRVRAVAFDRARLHVHPGGGVPLADVLDVPQGDDLLLPR